MAASKSTSSIQRYGTLVSGLAVFVSSFVAVVEGAGGIPTRSSPGQVLAFFGLLGVPAFIAIVLTLKRASWWLVVIGAWYLFIAVAIGRREGLNVITLTIFLAGLWFFLVPFLPRFSGRD